MIAKRSKLKLLTTDVLESSIVFHPNSLDAEEVLTKMFDAPVIIDFDIKINEEGLYYAFVTIGINKEESADFGYSINVTGASVFEFEDDTPDDEKQDLISSGVNITITHLRGYINAVTSYYPLGSFSFHSIDMKALFQEKAKGRKESSKVQNSTSWKTND